MPATSSYTQIIQAIWNSIRTYAPLVAFRAGLQPQTGGRDFDLSDSDNWTLPGGESGIPSLDESPAIAVLPSNISRVQGGSSKQWIASPVFSVVAWISTENIDQYHRFMQLILLALATGAEMQFVDFSSPALSFPNLTLTAFESGETESLIDGTDQWWKGEILISTQYPFTVS